MNNFITSALQILTEDNICHYPNSNEPLSRSASFAKHASFKNIGFHWEYILPGRRTSWPHAESTEEEFAFVVSGFPTLWWHGELIQLKPGMNVCFPPGSGITHTILNNTLHPAVVFVGGEHKRADNKLIYPHHPHRKKELGNIHWDDAPEIPLGPAKSEAEKLSFPKYSGPLNPVPFLFFANIEHAKGIYPLLEDLGYKNISYKNFLLAYENLIMAPNSAILAASINDRIIGFANYNLTSRLRYAGKGLVIEELAVAMEFRGNGLGKYLLQAVEAIARSINARCLELSTNRARESYQRAFYSKCGFTEKNSALFLKDLELR